MLPLIIRLSIWLVLVSPGFVAAADRVPAGAASAESIRGSDASHAEADAAIAQMQKEQQALLSGIRRDLGKMPAGDPVRDQKVRLLAEIERQINEQGGYPRRRYLSPGRVEEPFVQYYEVLVHRIEVQGTGDFPQLDGQRLYGEPVLNLTIDAQGRVVEIEVVHTSGNAVLDRKAAQIARAAAPFGPFSAAMRKKVDQIVTTARFRFVHAPAPLNGDASSSASSGAGQR